MLAPSSWAQNANEGSGDAPDHGVARLSFVQGNVSIQHGDQGDLSGAVVNAPLVAADQVMTGDGGRAEIQFDGENMIRLAPSTQVRLSELQFKQYQVQIAEGTTTFRVQHDNDAQIDISTPTVSVRPVKRGTYRVTVQSDGMTEITVREGQAEIFSPTGSEDLNAGQTMMARGTASNPEVQVVAGIPTDDWDRWNSDRDRDVSRAEANSRYVSPDVYGTESLDPYGRWVYDPAYGYVWVPSEPADWAPYRVGRWVWIDYYGWTWLSGDPWGWAPYHYGSWYYGSLGWAWYPGPIGVRYYWRPALVGFFGWGSGVGFGFGFGYGNIGWVPLAPHEVFRPWYGGGAGFNRVNIVNNVNIVNVYHNARYTNAATSVRAGDFGRAEVNSRNFVHASSGDLARAGSMRGAVPFAPSGESRRMTEASVNTRGIPRTSTNRQFSSARTAVGSPDRGGWRRFGTPGPASTSTNRAGNFSGNSRRAEPQGSTAPANGGWRKFEGSNPGTPQQTSSPRGGGSAPQNRNYAPPQQNRNYAPPQQNRAFAPQPNRGYSPQQPLRINPPIVRERGSQGGGGYNHPQSHAGNFGGAHAGGGEGPRGGGGSRGGGGGGGGRGGRR